MSAPIRVKDLTIGYGDTVIQQRLTFDIHSGEIFVIMGGSGCGKSTLLKHLIGLLRPLHGEIRIHDESLWQMTEERRNMALRRFGITYQSGALLSSLTVGDNIALPLQQFTQLEQDQINDLVRLKLKLVGLGDFAEYYPAQLSGGMQKRAALARAIALDPEVLFFDEPSAGLDPISARLLDDLILELRDNLGATVVIVTHELASIFAIGDNSIFLDAKSKTMIAQGSPRALLDQSDDKRVRSFLTRGGEG